MSIEEFRGTLNEWGARKIPFLFLVDFEMQKPLVFRMESLRAENIRYSINGRGNDISASRERKNIAFNKVPPAFTDYKKKYDQVRAHLAYGDSYLANLTIKTKIETAVSLTEIFDCSQARYKLLFRNHFLVFSPETFIMIKDGRIYAFPMKGTIDAALPDARKKILEDPKELAEHVTIVDLLRNDLSGVSENVEVTRFRYVDEIRTNQKHLLQVSSEIRGDLAPGYHEYLGDILVKLLPAGSVSGAPKCKTVEILRKAENEPRGYYTGVMGIFDGNHLDSGVMIRFMEYDGRDLYYRSGGGITVQSVAALEYQEAIDKVYVPLD